MVRNLGRIAEARLDGHDPAKEGNYLYGAFGHDFETRDGRRVMVVALTARQWSTEINIVPLKGTMFGNPSMSWILTGSCFWAALPREKI